MPAGLLWGLVEHTWIPAASELLDRRYIDRAVVQELFDLGSVDREETTVGADRVATQRYGSLLGDVLFKKRHGLRYGIFEADRGFFDLGEQARLGVHVANEVVHRGHCFGWLVDHQTGAFGNDVQLIVGQQCGDLDNDVLCRVEAGHFQVHPSEHHDTIGDRGIQ